MAARTISVDPEVKQVFERARLEDGVLLLGSEQQLPRPLYVKVDKALKALGGKWNRGKGGHVFPNDETLAKVALLIDGEEVERFDHKGYFPTPDPLVDRLLELAEVEPHHHVLEPSAGRGAIAHRLAEIVPSGQLHMVELQADHAEHLPTGELAIEDFMGWNAPRGFDRVVMNPPFERDQDIRHVLRAYDMLAPGGVLVAVMGAGAETRRHADGLRLRALLDAGHVETNPEGSFKQAGTNVRTITVQLTVGEPS
jgi:hypothetical protein